MAEVVNLNRARKAKKRAEEKVQATANRVSFGRTTAQKKAESVDEARRQRELDGSERER